MAVLRGRIVKKFDNPAGGIGTAGTFQSGRRRMSFSIRSFNASRRLLLASPDTGSMISDMRPSHSEGNSL
jgi:hypothetical protein